MQQRSLKLRKSLVLLPAAAAVALALAGCGGGGGGTPVSTSAASLKGAAIDAPVAGAIITITSGAPLTDGGTSIGTITADAQGGFSIQVTLPSGSVPIFANAAEPNPTAGSTPLELTSYLGQSDALAAAGALDSSTNLPDLDISPVTTAALAVYAATHNNSYAALTPAAYAITLSTYRNDILAIAAAVKAVGDDLCTPASPITSTTDLALQIALNAKLSSTNTSSTTLATASAYLGGSCTALPALQAAILADSRFGPELDLGDLIEANVQAVLPGTYALQSVIAETPVSQTVNTQAPTSGSLPTVSSINPAEVFVDAAVTIDASGSVTSTDKAVSGSLYGNLLTLQITDASGHSYQLRAKVASLPTALSSGGQAYNVQGGGVNTSNQALTMFSADLVPVSSGSPAAPQWDAFWNVGTLSAQMSSDDSGVQGCTAPSLPLRFDLSAMFARNTVSDDSFASLAECVAPTSGSTTSWTMTAATATSFDEYRNGTWTTGSGATLAQAGAATGTVVWNEAAAPTAAPYVMQADNVTLTPPGGATTITGSAYYVLGSRSVVVSPAAGATNPGSAILNIQGRLLSPLSESDRNSSDGGQSSSMGDH